MLKLLSIFLIIYLTKSAHSVVSEWQQCGGDGYRGETVCDTGLLCCKQHQYYSQCLRSCPAGWTTNDVVSDNKETGLPIYSQCGGQSYNGPTVCAAGLQCYQQTIYYSQCLTSCPSDWQCNGGSGSSTQAPTSGSTTNGNTASSTGSTGTLPPFSGNKWPTCKFRFGGSFVPDPSYDYSAWDYITIWIGSPSSDFGTNFNKWWHGAMLEATIKYKKTPVYYGYIIAFMARDMWGLQDCDVGTPSLCQRGSEFIRKNRAEIVAKYKHYAQETAKYVGSNAETIWLIEPDFWQYYGDTHQEGGPLSGAYMRSLFDDFAAAIKSELPNARLAWDISAWLSESAMSTWWGFFKSSNDIDYLFTSGGQSRANSVNIKPNELRWAFMSTLTGKRIIGDTGYGVAGGSTGHNYDWDDLNNLRARITDGVISVTQANPKKDWGTTLTTLRQQLAPLC